MKAVHELGGEIKGGVEMKAGTSLAGRLWTGVEMKTEERMMKAGIEDDMKAEEESRRRI